jgi:hypothetical protein
MKRLGKVLIPSEWSVEYGKAKIAREILAELSTESAQGYEFDSPKEASKMRSTLSATAICKYGEGGHLGTRIVDNKLYAWLKKKPEQQPGLAAWVAVLEGADHA